MTDAQSFNYEGFFSAHAPVSNRGGNRNARYDFAVAYPDPETLPLEGLVESLKTALDREGRDLAYYPRPRRIAFAASTGGREAAARPEHEG